MERKEKIIRHWFFCQRTLYQEDGILRCHILFEFDSDTKMTQKMKDLPNTEEEKYIVLASSLDTGSMVYVFKEGDDL